MTHKTLTTAVYDRVGVITVNRPEVRNAMNRQVMEDLRITLDEFWEDEGVGAMILTGAGDEAFVAGADIGELKERTVLDGLAASMQRLYDEIEGFDKPTIAAVNGYALGGGCELAMACDIRIAAEEAQFGLPEVGLSIIPGAGGTQRLARLVGKGRAIEMILTGRMIEAEDAYNIGLVSRVVPQAELMDVAQEMAQTILSKGPLAVRLAKLAVQTGFEVDQRTGQVIERLAQTVLYSSEDKQEGTSAFLDKRKPDFRGK
ncbi:MAG: enoyl-CoA hydratase/isomerase family protein [Rubrobacteraceae bacterium]